MDPLNPGQRSPAVCFGAVALAVLLSSGACRRDEAAETSSAQQPDATGTSSLAPWPAAALQIPPDQLTQIELSSTHRSGRGPSQSIVLAKGESGWRMVSPVEDRANRPAVEDMIAVLAEIEILESAPADPPSTRGPGVAGRRVEVKAWASDDVRSHFVIRRSTRERSYVQPVGAAQILVVRGRCLPIFDKTIDQLRHPIITDIDVKQIEKVTYDSPHGVLELVAEPGKPGEPRAFVPVGAPIENFHQRRATQQVGVLAHLFAKGFVAGSVDRESTGLFADDTPRATLTMGAAAGGRSIDVWVGKRTQGDRLYLRTSESEQIYLVSAHLETSLVPRRSHFERSDELMRQLKAKQEAHDKDAHQHTHGPQPSSTQVPPQLMSALRALAHEQSNQP